MPNDYLTLTALTKELESCIRGGKIEKIYQPERDEITLAVHCASGKKNLVISCNAQAPRIHFTTAKKENPNTAPTFCMHLRKLIGTGFVESVELLNNDRIICIKIISRNELKDTVKYRLIFEMMGRYSNIILISENDIILDAVKQVPFDTATKRSLLPGMPYSFPEQTKIAPNDYLALQSAIMTFNGDNLAKYICTKLGGIALSSAEEVCVGINTTPMTQQNAKIIVTRLEHLYNINTAEDFQPCAQLDDKGNAVDYYIKPYHSLGDAYKACATLSDAIELCTHKRDGEERHRERTKHLYSALKKFIQRNEKKLQKANEKLNECENMDKYRVFGELLTCNLHAIKRGDESVNVVNYYDENMPNVTIPLNKQLSPAKCAQDYFKRYNKLKRTLALIGGQIDETKAALDYAKSIESSLLTSSSAAELFQVEQELHAIGAIKKMKATLPKSVKAAEPFSYEYKDFVIMVGKNNYQNDRLTFKLANGGDLWLHTLDYHGSHVIIFAEAREIPDEVVQFSAELAAFYSGGNANDKVAVDYTFRKSVKRNPAGIGMVTYQDQHTAYVKPQDHAEFKIK